ncbi:metallophosphoesterase [Microbacterium sp. BK668]|uniref:metallophosphoesterase n=1 Tax=Microbacterium sp. BK668 TaxID=2512118 RepID=UPI0010611E7F|nr:metallophosphoesterase [Microbacterium sp. BK668]TDN92262.1 calcineurin-like phosphoesterase family protein [Microbacterium sp. BK668]
MSSLQTLSRTRTLLLLIGTMVLILGASLLSGPRASAAVEADCASFDSELLQVVRPASTASLVTLSSDEADSAAALYGFTGDEGVLAKVADSAGTGLTPVWRLYRAGDFLWAAEGPDLDAAVAAGYAKQFVGFYASTSDSGCLTPVYQLSRNGFHRLADAADRDALLAAGWTLDRVAFYAVIGAGAPADDDTKFSIAVIPDTQNEVTASDNRFANRVSWLVGNEERLDLRYATQVGDLSNWGAADPAQFARASTELKPLEQTMPWSGAIGNHDTGAVCPGGSACPGISANVAVRDTADYNAYFPVSRFPGLEGVFENGKVDNAFHVFQAGGADWLVLNLELWPRAEAVTWARSVVESHPGHNVIVVTHAYLEGDGSISGSNGGYGATSPRYLYDNLIKLYPNIKIVLSGHVGTAGSRTDVGVHGNKILSILTTYHSTTNPVRILEIDTAAGTATSSVYAPYTNTSFPGDATSTSGLSFLR